MTLYLNLPKIKHYPTRYPKEKTDRTSDLRNLLSMDRSFCLFSIPRNGATTLLVEYTKTKGGIYVDCMGLSEYSTHEDLESKIGLENSPLVLDEAVVMFRKLGGYGNAMDYLQRLSEKRQLGLRSHLECDQHNGDLTQRGFEIVEMGKMPYAEFKLIFDVEFGNVGFSIPERFIQYAHAHYDPLMHSIRFVAEAFKLLVENPDKDVTEKEVNEIIELKLDF